MIRFGIDYRQQFLNHVLSPSAKGWVFDPWGDFISFVLPLAMGLLVFAFPFLLYDRHPLSFFLFVLLADHGHIFATYIPIWKSQRRDLFIKIFVILLLSFIFAFAIAQRSPHLLLLLMLYTATFHTTRQHYGWLRISQRRTKPSGFRADIFERIVFWTLVLYPVSYLHSENRPFSPQFGVPGELFPVFIPRQLEHVFSLFFWIVTGAYLAWTVFRILRREPVPLGRNFFLLATWAGFYGGICLLQNEIFFFTFILCCHGFSYQVFVYKGFVMKKSSLLLRQIGMPLLYIFFLAAVGGFRRFGYDFSPDPAAAQETALGLTLLLSLLAAVTLSHYAWDMLLWRNRAAYLFERSANA